MIMNKTRKVFTAIALCVMMIFVTACQKKDNTPFKHGSWSGNTYTSEFFGIKIQLGADWIAIDDANLAKSVGISDMSESSIRSVFEKGGSIYEMMAAKTNGSSITISVQDSDQNIALSEKDFFELGIAIIKAQYEALGQKCTVEMGTVMFLGNSTKCLDITLTQNGTTVYCILIPLFRSHYTSCITFGSLSKPDLYSLVAMASAL